MIFLLIYLFRFGMIYNTHNGKTSILLILYMGICLQTDNSEKEPKKRGHRTIITMLPLYISTLFTHIKFTCIARKALGTSFLNK